MFMKLFHAIACLIILCITSPSSASEFTVCSYNCGGLSDHYDYLRGAALQKLMQERHDAEPELMALNEKVQVLALKILYAKGPQKVRLQREWDDNGYQTLYEQLTIPPENSTSPNSIWNERCNQMITDYKIRPVVIHDQEVVQMLLAHMADLGQPCDCISSDLLEQVRAVMATRIFEHQLKYDIICLQEADYLKPEMLPKHYQVLISEDSSKNGVAWNRDRFELIEVIGDIARRAFAVQLRDKQTEKSILVASGHITGCNPYRVVINPETSIADSAKGDAELRAVIDLFDRKESDVKIIGMDSNVTALHPRLAILKEAQYRLDTENYLGATCTNPNQILNTQIDWIAVKREGTTRVTVVNIPVLNVDLNSIQTNISDHKPIAVKVSYREYRVKPE
jgi:hypothetical protein